MFDSDKREVCKARGDVNDAVEDAQGQGREELPRPTIGTACPGVVVKRVEHHDETRVVRRDWDASENPHPGAAGMSASWAADYLVIS